MKLNLKSISVFCGSSTGSDPVYKEQAYGLRQSLEKITYALSMAEQTLVLWESWPMVLFLNTDR